MILALQAQGSLLPPAVDRAWEAIGGGPADLTFPDAFVGRWVVNSKLVKVDVPMGMDVLPSALVRCKRDIASSMLPGSAWS